LPPIQSSYSSTSTMTTVESGRLSGDSSTASINRGFFCYYMTYNRIL
jgi:hypothetical protein